MNIVLSWDLFVIVFFFVIVSYSFIIGRDNTLKVILGTYVAMIAADAGGNLFADYFGGSQMFMKLLNFASVGNEQEAMVFIKVMFFIAMVVIFAVRGAFEVDTVDDRSALIRLVLSVVYAVMSAGLVISAVLVFISGVSLVGGGDFSDGSALWGIYDSSEFIRSMVNNSYLWFSLPALSFLIHSLYTKKE